MEFFAVSGPYCKDGIEFDFEAAESTKVGDAPRCRLCGRFCGMLPLEPPIRGTLIVEGATFDLSSVSGGDLMLSERCLRVFERIGIQGLVKPRPIEVTKVEGSIDSGPIGKFYLADVVRWGAEIDRAASGLRTTESAACPLCGYAGLIEGYERICILDDSWTGQDLFRIMGLPGIILLTDRLRLLLIEHGLTVCNLVPAEQAKMGVVRENLV